jgi:hypothetical protein
MVSNSLYPPDQKASYYAVRDGDGNPVGFYHERVHGFRLHPVQKLVESETPGMPSLAWNLEPNPDCKIPVEAEAISDEEYASYFPSDEP